MEITFQAAANKDWIFEAEHPERNVLYIVAHSDPIAAEDMLREKIQLDDRFDIYALRPADEESLKTFNLSEGDIKGPM
jgi:hypothetical protein